MMMMTKRVRGKVRGKVLHLADELQCWWWWWPRWWWRWLRWWGHCYQQQKGWLISGYIYIVIWSNASMGRLSVFIDHFLWRVHIFVHFNQHLFGWFLSVLLLTHPAGGFQQRPFLSSWRIVEDQDCGHSQQQKQVEEVQWRGCWSRLRAIGEFVRIS